ncbi:MAG TPA: hypothetical protein VJ302_35545 [Blastocatellia bacterium]|nr:hypothetical protein [Blastocatellia bacterium]
MQKMECWSFKDLLDSYLSQELAVETNHAMLRHAEQCGICRREMAARRQLREKLRQVCLREKMSQDAYARLYARVRVEAYGGLPRAKKGQHKWTNVFNRIFASPVVLPAAITVAFLLFATGVFSLYLLRSESLTQLSAALFDETMGSHRVCAVKYERAEGPVSMINDAPTHDPAYDDLDKLAQPGAQGLLLRSAHICNFAGRRQFAHLVYTWDSRLISLMVTERDNPALKSGQVPADDGAIADLQRALRDGHFSLGAYQTAKHIVVVVSDLPEKENDALTQRLAVPVATRLREIERVSNRVATTLNLKPVHKPKNQ